MPLLPGERVDKQSHHGAGDEDTRQVDGANGEDLVVRRPLDVGVTPEVGAEVGSTLLECSIIED